MRKIILGLSVLVLLILMGCGTTNHGFVGDNQIPQEEVVTIHFSPRIQVFEYDGKPVKWVTKAGFRYYHHITTTPGTHEFKVRYMNDNRAIGMGATYSAGLIPVTYEYLPGKEYRFRESLQNNNSSIEFIVEEMEKKEPKVKQVSAN